MSGKKRVIAAALCAALLLCCVPGGQAAEADSAPVERVALHTSTIEEPYLYYTGNTWTKPGDVAMVHGANLDRVRSVELYRMEDTGRVAKKPEYIYRTSYKELPDEEIAAGSAGAEWSSGAAVTAKVLQQTENSLKFLVPADAEDGVWAVRLGFGEDDKAVFYYLNAPILEWAQGDEGGSATPGGWLRAQGTCLSGGERSENVRAFLRRKDTGKLTELKAEQVYDAYSVRFAVPKSIKTGAYEVLYYNGFGGETAWSEPYPIEIAPSPRKSWPGKVFDVTDFGAVSDGTQRCNAALQDALAAAEKNGGGIVYFPRGRYLLTKGGFQIPENTVIRGDSAEETLVYFTAFDWEYKELPDCLFDGTQNFALEDITFSGARVTTFLAAGAASPREIQGSLRGDAEKAEKKEYRNIYVRRCRFTFDEYAGMPSQTGVLSTVADMLVEEQGEPFLSIRESENVQLGDLELYVFNRPIGISGEYLLVQDIRQKHSWSTMVGQKTIVERVDWYNSTYGVSGNKMYLADQSWQDHIGNNRESMTTDGGSGGYNGAVRMAEDRVTFTLSDPKGFYKTGNTEELMLYIAGGKGAGQYRRILSRPADDTVVLDEPFFIDPDDSSVVSLGSERDSIFFVRDTIENSGAFQLYGFATNTVLSGMKLARAAGLSGWARFVYGALQVNWYTSFTDNEVADAEYFKYYGADNENNATHLKFTANGKGSGINLGLTVRDNRLGDGAFMSFAAQAGMEAMQNVLVQRNTVTGCRGAAIRIGYGQSAADAVAFVDNTLSENVGNYSYADSLLTDKNAAGQLRTAFFDADGDPVTPEQSYSAPTASVPETEPIRVDREIRRWTFSDSEKTFTVGGRTDAGTWRFEEAAMRRELVDTDVLHDMRVQVRFRYDSSVVADEKKGTQALQLISRAIENTALSGTPSHYAAAVENGDTLKLYRGGTSYRADQDLKTVLQTAKLDRSVFDGQWHTLTIDAVDERLVVSLDGTEWIHYTDRSNVSLLSGRAGLSVEATKLDIDDLAVYTLRDEHGGIEDNLAQGNYDWKTYGKGASK